MEQVNLLIGAINAYIRGAYRKKYGKKLRSKRYANKKLLLPEEANAWLYQNILSGKPFMAARYGGVELKIMQEYIFIKHNIKKTYDKKVIKMASNNAGIFDANERICTRFAMKMIAASSKVDLLGVWFNDYEDFMVKSYCKNALLTHLGSLEPYGGYESPWTHALKGKKVLVVHPFAQSIEEQYKKRDLIFPDGLLPEFELITLKAIQTIAGIKDNRFRTWFEALDYMREKIQKINFDVAIIGCGAYGFLLAEEVKKIGKQAVHLGGATQILFGIKGKRWDENQGIAKLYNEYWIRPQGEECPPQRHKVENGCYW